MRKTVKTFCAALAYNLILSFSALERLTERNTGRNSICKRTSWWPQQCNSGEPSSLTKNFMRLWNVCGTNHLTIKENQITLQGNVLFTLFLFHTLCSIADKVKAFNWYSSYLYLFTAKHIEGGHKRAWSTINRSWWKWQS